MESTASVKPPEGKLLEVAVKYDEEIKDVRITGDFFLEPPEAREQLESVLSGYRTDVERDTLIKQINSVDADLIGFDAADLADAIEEATA